MKKTLNLSQLVAKAGDELLIKLADKEILPIVDAFCKANRIVTPDVVYVGEIINRNKLRAETVMGKYTGAYNVVTLRLGRTKAEMIETLMHELTHAYQDAYHKDMLNYGRTQKARYSSDYGYDAYYYSVHEQHARICGADLRGVIRRNNQSELHLLRAFRKYNMEDAFHRINTEAYAI
jgi:hypothetical protein